MKPDINRYIRYCLFLFDNCTVNGLGTFQITQAPPKQDYNGNYIKEEKYTIAFSAVHDEKSRLTYLLCSKENYSETDAENLIKNYVKSVFDEIETKNEVWFKELGMLIKKDGELRFLSHKFTAKELKQQVSKQTSLLDVEKDTKSISPIPPVEELSEYTVNESFNVQDIITKQDINTKSEAQFSNFSNPEVPETPLIIRHKKKLITEETSTAAIFIPAVAHNNNAVTTPQSESAVDTEKSTFQIPAKIKKNIVYGLSIAGCLIASYFLYSFLIANKNTPVKNALVAVDGNSKTQENDLKPLVTEGTSNDNGIYSKTAAYPIPAGTAKNNSALANNNLPKSKKEETEITKTTTTTNNNEYIASAEQNEKYVTGKNIAIDKEAAYSEPVSTVQENAAPQLKPAVKPDVPPIIVNEKNITDTKAEASTTSAEFPGGNAKLSKYLMQKLVYPESGIEEAKEGVSIVRILIDKTGKIKNIEILNSLGADFDVEIRRAVSRMPLWIPAKKSGESVESSYNFKVNFKSINKQQPR